MNIMIALVALLLVYSSDTSAEFNLKLYNQAKHNEGVKSYFTGVGRGIFWANVVSSEVHGKQLFCFPPKLGLDEPIIHSLIEQEIENPSDGRPYSQDTPVELIMIKAFMSKFSCDK